MCPTAVPTVGTPAAAAPADDRVTREQVATVGAVDQVGRAAGCVAGRRDHLDAVVVDMAMLQRHVDGGELADLVGFGCRGMELGPEPFLDQREWRTGLVLVAQVLVVDTSEFVAGGQVAVSVVCEASFADIAMLAVPGSRTFEATAIEVIDTHRADTGAAP